MWIKGTINTPVKIQNINKLLNYFPNHEASLIDDQIVIDTRQLPVFSEHRLYLKILNNGINYRLWVPSFGPLILFLYLAVIFFSGFTSWRMLIVGSIIVTGIVFAIYVLNDKRARAYIQKHLPPIFKSEEDSEFKAIQNNQCPGCETKLTPYTQICPECGLHNKNARPMNSKKNHTGPNNINLTYDLKS